MVPKHFLRLFFHNRTRISCAHNISAAQEILRGDPKLCTYLKNINYEYMYHSPMQRDISFATLLIFDKMVVFHQLNSSCSYGIQTKSSLTF